MIVLTACNSNQMIFESEPIVTNQYGTSNDDTPRNLNCCANSIRHSIVASLHFHHFLTSIEMIQVNTFLLFFLMKMM